MSKSGKALGLPIVNVGAAGIDIGARIQVAAVPPELSDDPVRNSAASPPTSNRWPTG